MRGRRVTMQAKEHVAKRAVYEGSKWLEVEKGECRRDRR
jgi:hypothetical protein